ncbi:hypothetical protein BCR33DRAFT_722242 [Rhizoclosmatium globosum]|uniref:Uncharacterized protein n=1 Tax=Rhizoclosmatium globosum TaxID=329046 RepID=A0A1Y2BNJ8_9FUNG|nr:hypothetical protein BCR33DRAFT_722242 [Rhizoclosmatium globosum]|eukprot:ORY36147.1 hypothetical protein BCR33DRAFT_722242 [Rhizoclosmatium globosum]
MPTAPIPRKPGIIRPSSIPLPFHGINSTLPVGAFPAAPPVIENNIDMNQSIANPTCDVVVAQLSPKRISGCGGIGGGGGGGGGTGTGNNQVDSLVSPHQPPIHNYQVHKKRSRTAAAAAAAEHCEYPSSGVRGGGGGGGGVETGVGVGGRSALVGGNTTSTLRRGSSRGVNVGIALANNYAGNLGTQHHHALNYNRPLHAAVVQTIAASKEGRGVGSVGGIGGGGVIGGVGAGGVGGLGGDGMGGGVVQGGLAIPIDSTLVDDNQEAETESIFPTTTKQMMRNLSRRMRAIGVAVVATLILFSGHVLLFLGISAAAMGVVGTLSLLLSNRSRQGGGRTGSRRQQHRSRGGTAARNAAQISNSMLANPAALPVLPLHSTQQYTGAMLVNNNNTRDTSAAIGRLDDETVLRWVDLARMK